MRGLLCGDRSVVRRASRYLELLREVLVRVAVVTRHLLGKVMFPKNPTFAEITKASPKLSEAGLMVVRCRKFDDLEEALER